MVTIFFCLFLLSSCERLFLSLSFSQLSFLLSFLAYAFCYL